MEEKVVTQSGEIVQVGETQFRLISQGSFLSMVGKLEVVDPKTGETRRFRTSTPGWKAVPVDEGDG